MCLLQRSPTPGQAVTCQHHTNPELSSCNSLSAWAENIPVEQRIARAPGSELDTSLLCTKHPQIPVSPRTARIPFIPRAGKSEKFSLKAAENATEAASLWLFHPRKSSQVSVSQPRLHGERWRLSVSPCVSSGPGLGFISRQVPPRCPRVRSLAPGWVSYPGFIPPRCPRV